MSLRREARAFSRTLIGPWREYSHEMISSPWCLLLIGAAGASVTMICVWLVWIRIANASYVDVAWALEIAGTAVVYALLAEGLDPAPRARCRPRHDLGRAARDVPPRPGVAGKEEDGRYQELRRRWAPHVEPRVLRVLPGAGRVHPRLLAALRSSSPPMRGEIDVARVGRRRARARVRSPARSTADTPARRLEGRSRQQGQDCPQRPLGLVAPSELLLRVAALGRVGRHRALLALRLGGARPFPFSCSYCSSR